MRADMGVREWRTEGVRRPRIRVTPGAPGRGRSPLQPGSQPGGATSATPMFELVVGGVDRPFLEGSTASKVVALAAHAAVIVAVLAVPIFFASSQLPEVPSIMAFVASPPPPPPPAPPPPAPAVAHAEGPRPVTLAEAAAAPTEAPSEIRPEGDVPLAAVGGVEGGIVGGVAGGVVGGVVGSIAGATVPPPPPPAPAPVPVRVGGQIQAPSLISHVEPKYPDLAAAAQISGLVILEAVVGTDGGVESVRVLRSRGTILDEAAMEAVKLWRYSPLVLNGVPCPFILTVTVNFRIQKS